MSDAQGIKALVKDKYGRIAGQGGSCCSGGGSSGEVDHTVMDERYDALKGYVPEADLGLGCGLPTEFAAIEPGDVVVDLGSGAGNDVFIARSLAGETGRVIGIDMTPEMIDRARANNRKMGYDNVAFYPGEIEALPIEDDSADVVVSNCVLNLVPDKGRAFSEIYRILKTGGHFCISDVVLKGALPDALKRSAAMYVGCVAGALQQDEYLGIIERAGFSGVAIEKSKEVFLPNALLKEELSPEDVAAFRGSETGIFSITVVGYKS